ncbi:far upstream element-binding protein 2 isoform X2 [Colias croceus]|uniref:far upstream element-binding protein 2 isoform X2 n=1 Tax=Colias crocea TaxID=72248 RepID=UPI001E281684|nr:far upstream element-binding protein 2 isoform X2 [Colias croceus]
MSDYSSMATLQNNSVTGGFAAALQRAKLVAAKIEGGGSKRSLEDGPEPSSKKMASAEPPYSPPQMRELVNNIVNHRGRENAPQHQEQGMSPMPRGGGGGGGLGVTDEIMLPGPKVGLIIGKNGKTIKQLQEQSGAKMVVIQDGPNTEYEKPLRISGDASKVEHAKQLVYELLQDKDGGPGPRFDDGYQDQGNGVTSTEVLVPKIAVGVVIGRGGDMIKKIQNDSGCRVQFHQEREEGPGDKRCYLQGLPHQVDHARQMIEDLISSVNLAIRSGRGRPTNKNQGNNDRDNQQWQDSAPEVRVSFTVSNVKCGLIIGRGGEVIKQINAQSGAHCELDRRAQNQDRVNRTFFIKGHPDAVENCKRIIMEKVGMPVNFVADGGGEGNSGNGGNNGNSGGGGGGGGEFYGGGPAWGYNPHWHQQPQPHQPQQQQVQINPSTGQPDYSQQWIDYYRSLGLVKEAEAIEQQAKQQQQIGSNNTANTSSPSPAPAPAANNSAPDYSAQWAEYYRGIGKVKEAEAIEAQIKAKQQQQQQQAPPQQAPPAPTSQPSGASPGGMGQYPQYPMYPPVYPYAYNPYGGGQQDAAHQ